jgi:alpha-1,6-mannosyltransferase
MVGRAGVPWALLGAVGLMEVGWLIAAIAIRNLSEVGDLTDALVKGWIPVWNWIKLVRPETHDTSAAVLFVGLLLTSVGYVAAIAAVMRWRVPGVLRWVVGACAIFGMTLVLLPGILSSDVVMYGVYGRLAAVYGLNPYLNSGVVRPEDPLVKMLSYGGWPYPSPYGPVWTSLSVGLAALGASLDPVLQAFAYRIIGALAHAANAYLIWRLVHALNPRVSRDARTLAVVLYALNPLAMFELIAGGHNDGAMLSLVLAGLLVATSRRWWLVGIGVVWAGGLIKWVPGLVVLYLTSVFLRILDTWRPRLVRLVTIGAVVVGMTVVLFGPWLSDPTAPAGVVTGATAGGHRYVNALIDLPTTYIAQRWVDPHGHDLNAADDLIRGWASRAAQVVFVVYFAFELIRLWRRGTEVRDAVESGARTLLVALLLVFNQVLAWYFIWPLSLALSLGSRSALARVTVAYTVVYFPIFYALHVGFLSSHASLLIVGYVFAPLLVLMWPLDQFGSFLRVRLRILLRVGRTASETTA